MKKIIIWLLVVAVLGAAGAYLYYKASAKKHDPAKAEIIAIDAKELYRMFENFEDSANKLYTDAKKEKAIAVNGTIHSVEQKDNIYTVTLDAASDFGAVVCEMDTTENQKVKTLKSGSAVKIVGYCNGYLADVQMFRCKLAE